MKKIVISGAGGFLGREVLNQLSQNDNYSVVALTRYPERLSKYNGRVNIINSNDYDQIQFSNIDVLLSLAYPTNSIVTREISKGLNYVYSLISYAITGGVRCIVDVSTQSVYGVYRQYEADEDSPLDLDTIYGVGKYCVEKFIDNICSNSDVIHLRLASLIGPGLEERSVNKIIDKIIVGEEITVKNGSQVFGYMDYRDGASAIIACMNNSERIASKDILNISSYGYTLFEIIDCIKQVGKKYGYEALIKEGIDNICRNTTVNSKKMREITSWCPQYSLVDSVMKIFEDKVKENISEKT